MLLNYLLDSNLISSALILFAVTYACLSLMYRNKIINFVDPLNISLVTTSFSLSGFFIIITPHYRNYNFYLILLMLFLYFIVGAMAHKVERVKAGYLSIDSRFQLLFVSVLFILIMLNVIANYLLFDIPLLNEEGTYSRINMSNSAVPSLVVLAPFIGSLIFKYYLFTRDNLVKKISIIGFGLSLIAGLLSGSKGFLFQMLIYLSNYYFFIHLRCNDQSFSSTTRLEYSQLKRKTAYALAVSFFLVLLLLPLYLSQLKFNIDSNSNNQFLLILLRFFIGFDNFILLVSGDIDIHRTNLNLFTVYFFPFIHKFINGEYFQTSGQYLMYLISDDYELSKSGMNPNSNLILDLLFGLNVYVAIAVLPVLSYCINTIRVRLLEFDRMNAAKLILYDFFVFSPLIFFTDFAYFFTNIIILYLIYLFLNSVFNFMIFAETGTLEYRFH